METPAAWAISYNLTDIKTPKIFSKLDKNIIHKYADKNQDESKNLDNESEAKKHGFIVKTTKSYKTHKNVHAFL